MQAIVRQLFIRFTIAAATGAVAVVACTRTTDRVVEPVGGGDASTTTPDATDASVSPIGPVADPVEPAEDFRLVRAPEFGLTRAKRVDVEFVSSGEPLPPGLGGMGGTGGIPDAGVPSRPVSSGGSYF